MITSVEIMIGLLFVILGLSVLLRPAAWEVLVRRIIHGQSQNALLAVGGINLVLGAFIIAFHWIWYSMSMIVTLIGVLLFLRGSFTLLFPSYIQSIFPKFETKISPIIRFSGIVTVILGLLSFSAAWL